MAELQTGTFQTRRLLFRRWLLAAGWGLWLISLAIPTPNAGGGHLYTVYGEVLTGIARRKQEFVGLSTVMVAAAGFCMATLAMASSPFFVAMCRARRPFLRKLRWLGAGTIGMLGLVAVTWSKGLIASVYLFSVGHILAGIASIPWPGDLAPEETRGFEVVKSETDEQGPSAL